MLARIIVVSLVCGLICLVCAVAVPCVSNSSGLVALSTAQLSTLYVGCDGPLVYHAKCSVPSDYSSDNCKDSSTDGDFCGTYGCTGYNKDCTCANTDPKISCHSHTDDCCIGCNMECEGTNCYIDNTDDFWTGTSRQC